MFFSARLLIFLGLFVVKAGGYVVVYTKNIWLPALFFAVVVASSVPKLTGVQLFEPEKISPLATVSKVTSSPKELGPFTQQNIEALISLQPTNIEALLNAALFVWDSDVENRKKYLEKALEYSPNDPFVQELYLLSNDSED